MQRKDGDDEQLDRRRWRAGERGESVCGEWIVLIERPLRHVTEVLIYNKKEQAQQSIERRMEDQMEDQRWTNKDARDFD